MQPEYVHEPLLQDAFANGRLQSLPHVPHAVVVDSRFASQPFVADMSQSPKPALHDATRQVLAMHAPVPFAGAQSRPQPPQCVMVVRVSISQPSIGSTLQSP